MEYTKEKQFKLSEILRRIKKVFPIIFSKTIGC